MNNRSIAVQSLIHELYVRAGDVRVGDLGCAGVDTDRWLEANRVQLFPGKINRWVLARTLRDRPGPEDLQNTLIAVFNKWFSGSPIDPAISLPLDPKDKRAGVTDGIRIVSVNPERPVLQDTIQTRERLPMSPPPTLNAKSEVIFLTVEFNYRGLNKELAWPVCTAPGIFGVQLKSTTNCPLDADWMLTDVASPLQEAPPKKDVVDIITDETGNVLKPVVKAVETTLYVTFAMAAVGLLMYAAIARSQAMSR